MSDRKITIKLDEKNLLDVIEELKIAKTKRKFWKTNEIFLTLDLPDTKDTYVYLTKSKKILDWSLGELKDFKEGSDIPETDNPVEIEEHPSVVKRKKREKEKEARMAEEEATKKEQPEKEENPEIVLDKFTKFELDLARKETSVYLGLSYFIEATWRVSRKSPGIVFGTPLFKTSVEKEYEEIRNGMPVVERALLQKVIESYYPGITEVDAVLDINDKIRTRWKILSQCETLTSVSIMLFRNA